MFVHIFPNVSHVVLVQLSILTVAFIKSEVILSFLGFGVPVDVVSWGTMLERGAERADPRQVVAARRGDRGDGHAGHRVQPPHRRAARRARSQTQGPGGALTWRYTRQRPRRPRPRIPTRRWSACATCRSASASTRRSTFEAVKGISFDIPRNSTVALVGESGSGKSVTSLAILGLLPPENSIVDRKSQIIFGGRNLVGLSMRRLQKLRGADISMIFQEPMTSLNPVFTCGYQIEEVLKLHMGLAGAAARRRALELLDEVGIPDPTRKINAYPVADVGRPAAARDDRDGDRLRAQAPDRRRADHRARRHDPEADPRPDRRAAATPPDVGAVHHPRPRGGRRDRRPRRRHAPRRDPRAGRGEGRVRASAGQLHAGAAAMPPAARPSPGAPAGHRRLHQRARAAAPRGARARHQPGRRRRSSR